MKRYTVKSFLWKNEKGVYIVRYGVLANGACVCINPFYSHKSAIRYILKIEQGKIPEPLSGAV